MTRKSSLLLSAAAFLSVAVPAHSATIIVVPLTNAQETGPPVVPTLTNGTPRPTSFGTATLVLNDAMTALTYAVSVFNIDFTGTQTSDTNDNLVAAHFHAGPVIPPSGNLGVVFGFFGTPFNDTNPNDVVVAPLANGVGGTISGKWDAEEGFNTTLAAQLPNIFAGRSYLNFHTTQFTGGEIRGNIPPIPEPSTWAMMLVGFGAVGAVMRRRRANYRKGRKSLGFA